MIKFVVKNKQGVLIQSCWSLSAKKIGKLLLAVDQTGSEAWQPLIKTIKQRNPNAKFMLYSGRHGAMEGCFQDNGKVTVNAADIEFYNDDVRQVNVFKKPSKVDNFDIEVVDTGHLEKPMFK